MLKMHYDPKPGIFDIEDDFLSSASPLTGEPADGQPWEYILWGRFKSNHRKALIVLTGDTESEVICKLVKFAAKSEILFNREDKGE